jgi:oligopeptide transport system permease protein
MDTRDQFPRYTSNPADNAMAPDNTMIPAPPEMSDMLQGHVLGVAMPDVAEVEKEGKSPTPLQESLRRLRRDKRAMVSISVIAFFVLLAIFGPPIYQHIGGLYLSPLNGVIGPDVYHTFYHEELTHQDELPSAMYWLGTDSLGRDMLARLMQGLLISLSVALLVEIVDISLGITVGVLAGFHGGWIDQFLARFTDVMFAFPGLLFVILILGIFGPSVDEKLSNIPIIGANGNERLLLVSFALAFTIWPLMARYVRGQTLQLKEQQFVEAARTAGTTNNRIILRHIIPNLFSIVVVAATLNISNTIVAEAGISLLGLGVQPPGSSIGLMISNAADLIDTHPWEVIVPSVMLAIIVLCFSFFGDGLRDAFDPRSKD